MVGSKFCNSSNVMMYEGVKLASTLTFESIGCLVGASKLVVLFMLLPFQLCSEVVRDWTNYKQIGTSDEVLRGIYKGIRLLLVLTFDTVYLVLGRIALLLEGTEYFLFEIDGKLKIWANNKIKEYDIDHDEVLQESVFKANRNDEYECLLV